jgi:helix-turn-helix, Psq domain
MPRVNKQAIQDAIQAYHNKEFDSIRKTAEAFSIASSTLYARL